MSRLVRDSSEADSGKCGKLGGVIDGSNATFTCSWPLAPGTQDFILVFRNGLLQNEGSGLDYMLGDFSTVLKIIFNANQTTGTKLDVAYYAIAGGTT